MESMEVSAELTGRDGGRRPFRVSCERTLRGLQGGLEQLQGEVTAELSQLVEQEKGGAPNTGVEEAEEEEDDDDDDEVSDSDSDSDEEDAKNNGIHLSAPPTKRKKT